MFHIGELSERSDQERLRARPMGHSPGLEPLRAPVRGAVCGITARARECSTMTHTIDRICLL